MTHRLFALPILAACALVACGGGNDDVRVDTTPEAQRPQDTRLFAAVQTGNTFAAMAGVPETDRWAGILKGAAYQVEVPKNWNGMLVMYAHGYAGTGEALTVAPPAIRRYLLSQGYAWAASSYSKNYYDVRAGVEDTNALALAFNDIARQNGRNVSAPSKVYITGVSMGGHITAAAVDEENIRSANNRIRYAGAVPMCGVLGDTELFDYFAAYQTAAQQEAGLPATSWPPANWNTIGPQVQARLFSSFPGGSTPTAAAVPTAQGQRLKAIVQNLTGGTRPLFDFAYAGALQATVWGVFGRDGKLQGILNEDVNTSRDTVFQFDANAALTSDEQAFNATIFRVQATPDANRLRRDGLRWVPKTNAQISVPMVTIHTLGDMYVPFSMEQIYKRRADKLGTSNLLVQRAIRGISHCDFTVAEQASAFDAMVKWEQTGVKPAGDEVLAPATVADPQYGCKFTDNTVGPDDSAATGRTRAALPACAAK
ncbi:alpha/beta hydrolase family protein [Massilia sp. S19_KUP03_FR1]|uniref:alpha/beta hydrolase family protein n=1 Tax=Massilia sp. S19_KUP03_FR1 TaxID=3025503 RepID=UPI002FCDA693